MLVFIAIVVLCLLLLAGWIWHSHRATKPPRAAARESDTRIYALNTQMRSVEPPEHSTGRSFGLLLRAARGDRAAVEKWISNEQYRGQVPLSRDEAIELLAQRLQTSRG